MLGMPVLLLTTAGRRSGTPRTAALHYLPDGDRYIVIGSNAGEPRHPGWFLNLRAEPRAEMQVGPAQDFGEGRVRRGRAPAAPLVARGGGRSQLRRVSTPDTQADPPRRPAAGLQ